MGFAHEIRFGIAVCLGCIVAAPAFGSACVWKVTHKNGAVLYLGGSVHALNKSDYPLPVEYTRACDHSNRLVFEVDTRQMKKASKALLRVAEYSGSDGLKNHVDPGTYAYVRRFFKALNVPEEKFAKLRPWALAFLLQAPQLHGLSPDLGVEGFLTKRAEAQSKEISGLETVSESINCYSGLTDQQSELMLLMSFMPGESGTMERIMKAWRRGDSETIWQAVQQAFRDAPSIAEREITRRNRNWIPKIEKYLESKKPCFIVVGAAHLGGPNGVLSLLRGRGYTIEPL